MNLFLRWRVEGSIFLIWHAWIFFWVFFSFFCLSVSCWKKTWDRLPLSSRLGNICRIIEFESNICHGRFFFFFFFIILIQLLQFFFFFDVMTSLICWHYSNAISNTSTSRGFVKIGLLLTCGHRWLRNTWRRRHDSVANFAFWLVERGDFLFAKK